ncbi:MAG: NAD(P)-dependent methylenetetrahydromethanopterin dehydrogenase [Acidobacteriota bacterium]
MGRKNLLHLISSDPHVSPFDVNMAYDAGFEAVIPYAGVTEKQFISLVQDAMFSRGPKGARHTALFIGGSNLSLCLRMLEAARKTLFDPFRLSLMVDPKGAFTTAAALVAKVRKASAECGLGGLEGRTLAVLGGTGTVGRVAAALAAREGARVVLSSRRLDGAQEAAGEVRGLFGARVEPRQAGSEEAFAKLVSEAEIVLATAAAGVKLLSRSSLQKLGGPRIIADVNAVPPSGIEGLEPQADGAEIAPGVFGLGALAIGDLKFRTEAALLSDLRNPDERLIIESQAAYERATQLLA